MKSRITSALDFFYQQIVRTRISTSSEEPVFVVGCGHSGTTIMLRILSEHSQIYGVRHESKVFLKKYLRYSQFIKWKNEANKVGKTRWVEKTPRHINKVPQIVEVFPRSRIILMQRDGRDVTVSIRTRRGNSKEGLKRWVSANQTGLAALDYPQVMAVRLEDLTSNPEETVRKVCKHIQVKFEMGMIDYSQKEEQFTLNDVEPFKTDKRMGVNHTMNRVWQVNQPIFKNTSRWEMEATPEEKELFVSDPEFKEVMSQLGY